MAVRNVRNGSFQAELAALDRKFKKKDVRDVKLLKFKFNGGPVDFEDKFLKRKKIHLGKICKLFPERSNT